MEPQTPDNQPPGTQLDDSSYGPPQPVKKKSRLPLFAVGAVIIVVVAVGIAVWMAGHKTPVIPVKHQSVPLVPATTTGSDNQSLQNDLNDVTNSSNQGASDMQAADNGLNDQQQEVAVPTN